MVQYFPQQCEHSGVNVKFELELSNYATKADLEDDGGIGAGIKNRFG